MQDQNRARKIIITGFDAVSANECLYMSVWAECVSTRLLTHSPHQLYKVICKCSVFSDCSTTCKWTTIHWCNYNLDVCVLFWWLNVQYIQMFHKWGPKLHIHLHHLYKYKSYTFNGRPLHRSHWVCPFSSVKSESPFVAQLVKRLLTPLWSGVPILVQLNSWVRRVRWH